MRFCDQCGNLLNETAKFCVSCGAKIADNCTAVATDIPKEAQTTGNDTKLRDYLEQAVSLERSIYTQNQTIAGFWDRINRLGYYSNIWMPQKPNHLSSFSLGDIIEGIGGAMLVGAFVGAACSGANGLLGGAVLGAIVAALILIVGAWLLCFITDAQGNAKRDRIYESQMIKYRDDLDMDQKRVKKENEEKNKLTKAVREMEAQRDETCEVLEQFYAAGPVFPKYRSLIPMCSMYEYFISGRCSSLTGHEGAYNIYENEVRLDRICTKLDEVIQNLQQIQRNQFVLFQAIQEGNEISQKILDESINQTQLMGEIGENTALAARNAEIAANNAAACAWISVANYESMEDAKRRMFN